MSNDSSIDRVGAALRESAQQMRPRERLPSTRELTARYGVSPVTLSRALAALAAEGVLVTRPGSGTYVAERVARAAEPPDLSWQTVALEDVLVTGGAQAALSAAFRAIVPSGAPVLLESPTYLGAIAVARAARLRTVPVPTDDHGVQPDLLAAAFAATGARLFYCQPTFQNPTGAVLAGRRRQEVLDAARQAGAFIIEDDF